MDLKGEAGEEALFTEEEATCQEDEVTLRSGDPSVVGAGSLGPLRVAEVEQSRGWITGRRGSPFRELSLGRKRTRRCGSTFS